MDQQAADFGGLQLDGGVNALDRATSERTACR
jgi:hypothetical protein